MTVLALLADPPRDGSVLTDLVASTPLSASEAADLYTAVLADAMRSVDRSGGELLVNYAVPDGDDEADIEAELRAVAAEALEGTDDVRFEVQVGSDESAVVGNTITHLLEREEATTAAIFRPEAVLVDRSLIDSAAMLLRRNEVVLGPAPEGRIYYAGFREPIDFEGGLAPPALETLAARGHDAGYDVAVEQLHPLVDSASGLRSTLSLVRSRRQAGLRVPPSTTAVVEDLGLAVEHGEEGPTIVRR